MLSAKPWPRTCHCNFLPTEVVGPNTAVMRQAHAAFFVDPKHRNTIKTAVALAEAQAVKNLALQNRLEGEAAARDEAMRSQLEAIDWDDDSDDESESKGAD
jgi:protocatechuate 3,4-dioxygenase beta subunit